MERLRIFLSMLLHVVKAHAFIDMLTIWLHLLVILMNWNMDLKEVNLESVEKRLDYLLSRLHHNGRKSTKPQLFSERRNY